jgi:hypothetical protein
MIHINVLGKQLMWATLILIMRMSMGSRKLAWPIVVVVGLFSVVSIMDIEGISPMEEMWFLVSAGHLPDIKVETTYTWT